VALFSFLMEQFELFPVCSEERQHIEEEQYDYAAIMDQMATRISVRYGNSLMEESEPFIPGKASVSFSPRRSTHLSFRLGNYSEKLRVIDFPVYVSGKDDPKLTPLVPVN
jgi:hypothetical protein